MIEEQVCSLDSLMGFVKRLILEWINDEDDSDCSFRETKEETDENI